MNRVVIIGNSASGLSALENFRKYDTTSDVTILSKEGNDPYSRVLIPYILREKIPYRGLNICKEDYFKDYHATLVCDEVLEIDTKNQRVNGANASYPYHQLLIATGSHAVSPPIEGIESEGIFHMWTKDDLDHLIPYFNRCKRVCVIGSGFVALQAAWAARCRGLEVVVVELMDRIMPNVLDEKGAEILSKKMRAEGVTLHTSTSTQSFEKMENGTFQVHLAHGEDVTADFIVVGTGVRPNVEFLQGSGITVQRGIPVNEHMATNIPNVYASGDVAAGPTVFGDSHQIHALWPTACEMGKIAGENMAGLGSKYEGSLNMNVTEMFGVTVASMGKFNDSQVDESYVFNEDAGCEYLKICYEDGMLVGGCLVGNSEAVKIFGKMRPLIQNKAPISCEPKDVYNYLNKVIFDKVWRKGL